MTRKLILAAIGKLPQDDAVMGRASRIAQDADAVLGVIHALDLPGDRGEACDPTSFLGQAVSAARERIELALSDLRIAPERVDLRIEIGPHARTLIDACAALGPDLMVMRAHQNSDIRERFLGSTVERVISTATVPVLVVKRADGGPYARIAVATDGRDDALAAARFASGICPRAKLALVQSVEIPPQLEEAMLRVGSRREELAAMRARLRNDATRQLGGLAGELGGDTSFEVLKGDAARSLTRFCRRGGADLLVMGQGRGSLIRRAFIGSVSRKLLRDAACDVLIWPAGDTAGTSPT
ncbi:universal stress protein [Palleronia sediminis]|uniref:Universal stress protein n=1 Tax=Palleronia sediminis TaxID=2547833 RepID=A0A4R6AE47_9RHOB|nr:universal stress protein [Palleronia sediminis]TDL81487.1 universal stress protein [Palleronia sediminis]